MNKNKLLKNAKMFVLIIGVIYLTLTVLACISAVNDIKNMSTTSVGVGTVLSLVWFHICILVFLAFTYYMYSKERSIAVVFEIIIAVALILNVVVNMIVLGAISSLVFLNFIIPVAMLIHSFLHVYGIYLENKQAKIKEEFNIK